MVVAQKIARREVKTIHQNVFYLEKRPQEGGRTTLVFNHKEILPKEFDVKSKVHEYGGGAYAVSEERIIFVNKKDQQLYAVNYNFEITPLTKNSGYRFADGVIDENNNCSYWVCENHADSHEEPENSIIKVSHATASWGEVTAIASGADFYSSPTFYKDKLAFISWSHPNMPWDDTELNLGEFKDNSFKSKVIDSKAWISEPQFDKDGRLFYIKEDSEFSNLYFYDGVINLFHKNDREYSNPGWNFGTKSYALHNDFVIASSWKDGVMQLEIIKDGSKFILEEYCGFSNLNISQDCLFLECYSYEKDNELVSVNLTDLTHKVIIPAGTPTGEVSIPESIIFKSTDGECQGFLYLPLAQQTNLPLIVISHGGPTGMSPPFYNVSIQYWVDKGFAVFDVNYRGSTGFGKTYRNALNGKWGLLDVDDCVNAALYCVSKNIADPNQLIIRGSSAGGYTTMAALTFNKTFKAGASYYGICDLNMLATSTHKFESRYLDTLIAPFKTSPEEFSKRSPVNYIGQITCPMIVFQGEEDKVVPKDQAQTIYDNLIKKGIDCELFMFADESHGFGKEENLITCLVSELNFYKKTFNFK